MEDVKVLELDQYELKTIINALNEMRTQLIKEERPTDVINELLLKVIDAPLKKKALTKVLRRDSARRY